MEDANESHQIIETYGVYDEDTDSESVWLRLYVEDANESHQIIGTDGVYDEDIDTE